MKNREKNIALIAAGIVLGTAVTGPAANAAEMLAAQRSTQKIFINGQQAQMEAYNIGGSNYVKLRDVGKAIGFEVVYDPTTNNVYIGEQPKQADSRIVTLPTDGGKYTPKVGDLIPCDDGTFYEVKDTLRFENNVYAPGALPDLPEPACDWGLFNSTALPKVEVKHYCDQYGDDLFVRNLYETRRMQYTIYNALSKESTAWKNGKPLATVELEVPSEYEAYTAKFWPWRENQITDLVHSRPNSRYYVSAWDYYHDGVYQYCRYCVLSL